MREVLAGVGDVTDGASPVPDRHPRTKALSDPALFERRVFADSRGTFGELWRDAGARTAGLPGFVQDNVARSWRGVVRGLHFQHPHAQAKLITVIVGEVFDVAVDVRMGSPTFGRWTGYALSEDNGRQLFVPPGFAHGYQTVSDTSVVIYKCSDYYAPDAERVIRWNDDALGIEWPIADAIVSARDGAAPLLRELLPEWLPRFEP
jgi:dTDP-4-dehydrorhamnose 3,5-epimerase